MMFIIIIIFIITTKAIGRGQTTHHMPVSLFKDSLVPETI